MSLQYNKGLTGWATQSKYWCYFPIKPEVCSLRQRAIFLFPPVSLVTRHPASRWLRYTGCLLSFRLKESLSPLDLVSLRSAVQGWKNECRTHTSGGGGKTDLQCMRFGGRIGAKWNEKLFFLANRSAHLGTLACVVFWGINETKTVVDISFSLQQNENYI